MNRKRCRNGWDRRQREKQCGRKRQYESRAKAYRAIKELRARDDDPMTVYECPWCGWFHIGHESKRDVA